MFARATMKAGSFLATRSLLNTNSSFLILRTIPLALDQPKVLPISSQIHQNQKITNPCFFARSFSQSSRSSNTTTPQSQSYKTTPKKLHKILSIDGGGIRGVIPARILVEIEKRTKKPISELFDSMAGTSTGAILILGLNVPDERLPKKSKYSATELLTLYLNQKGSLDDSLGIFNFSGVGVSYKFLTHLNSSVLHWTALSVWIAIDLYASSKGIYLNTLRHFFQHELSSSDLSEAYIQAINAFRNIDSKKMICMYAITGISAFLLPPLKLLKVIIAFLFTFYLILAVPEIIEHLFWLIDIKKG